MLVTEVNLLDDEDVEVGNSDVEFEINEMSDV